MEGVHKRIVELDVMRVFATLLVIVGHCGYMTIETKWGDCPKTQKSILKVEDSAQYTTIVNKTVVSENDFVEHSNTKVENDNQSKIVFGRPMGGV